MTGIFVGSDAGNVSVDLHVIIFDQSNSEDVVKFSDESRLLIGRL